MLFWSNQLRESQRQIRQPCKRGYVGDVIVSKRKFSIHSSYFSSNSSTSASGVRSEMLFTKREPRQIGQLSKQGYVRDVVVVKIKRRQIRQRELCR